MAGSVLGTIFKISTWGESHGKGVGVVVDGCPAGLDLCEDDIQKQLDRRKPGQSKYATPRQEDDTVEILSGVFSGKTTGTPISMIVWNKNQQSKDYRQIADCYRPGHADYTFDMKYGFRDYRGGGRSSGRETIGRVAAGAVAIKILEQLGIEFLSYTASIGPVKIAPSNFFKEEINKNPFFMPDATAALKAESYLQRCLEEKDSSGGTVECIVKHLPCGIGETVFEKLDANLGKALLSIGAVKGVEIGDGYRVSEATGQQNNDMFQVKNGQIEKKTNHSGGVLGGISDGSDLIIRASIKPTPSISAAQQTITKDMEEIDICIGGRHDPIIAPRAVVVVESMVALTLVDLLFISMTSKMEDIITFFEK